MLFNVIDQINSRITARLDQSDHAFLADFSTHEKRLKRIKQLQDTRLKLIFLLCLYAGLIILGFAVFIFEASIPGQK